MTFKDQIAFDNKAIINPSEFGERRIVNGKFMTIVLDSVSSADASSVDKPGLYTQSMVLYVLASEYGPKPKPEAQIIIDNKIYYRVTGEVQDDMGVYTIPIERNRVR